MLRTERLNSTALYRSPRRFGANPENDRLRLVIPLSVAARDLTLVMEALVKSVNESLQDDGKQLTRSLYQIAQSDAIRLDPGVERSPLFYLRYLPRLSDRLTLAELVLNNEQAAFGQVRDVLSGLLDDKTLHRNKKFTTAQINNPEIRFRLANVLRTGGLRVSQFQDRDILSACLAQLRQRVREVQETRIPVKMNRIKRQPAQSLADVRVMTDGEFDKFIQKKRKPKELYWIVEDAPQRLANTNIPFEYRYRIASTLAKEADRIAAMGADSQSALIDAVLTGITSPEPQIRIKAGTVFRKLMHPQHNGRYDSLFLATEHQFIRQQILADWEALKAYQKLKKKEQLKPTKDNPHHHKA